MNLGFDACSLLNLHHGQVLEKLASTKSYQGCIGPLVRDECTSMLSKIADLVASGSLLALEDVTLSPVQFGSLLATHGLGVGETECLAHAHEMPELVISCDDGRARKVLRSELGSHRVTGTLGLVVQAVRDGLLSLEEAFASYTQMIAKGGFLPQISAEAFKKLVEDS